MTVGDLKEMLKEWPDEMLVGAEDADGVMCEIQSAGVSSWHVTGQQFFSLHANGGYPLFENVS